MVFRIENTSMGSLAMTCCKCVAYNVIFDMNYKSLFSTHRSLPKGNHQICWAVKIVLENSGNEQSIKKIIHVK